MNSTMLEIDRITDDLLNGLRDLSPGPKDVPLEHVWSLYTDIVHMCGWRLLEQQFGVLEDAAEEVRIYLEHFEHIARIADVFELLVPKVMYMQLMTLRNYVRDTTELDELTAFLRYSATITAQFAEYVKQQQGRDGRPLYELLVLLSKLGGVFQSYLDLTIPEG